MIRLEHVSKRYGARLVLDDLNIDIEPGRIYGFLGANGAGKSTTMNIITGYIAPSEGKVEINGMDIYKEPEKAKGCIGYLPEIPPLHLDMTVLEYLDYVAELKRLPRKTREAAVEEACITTGVSDVAGRLIRNLSKGYKQRVGIAQAILGNPDIIILDEPTVGLDPAQIIEVRELISNLGKEHTVILSSHILTEISAVCDYIFIISKGKMIAADTTDNLMNRMAGAKEIDVVLEGNVSEQAVLTATEAISGIDHVEYLSDSSEGETHILIYSKPEVDIRGEIFRLAVQRDWTLLNLSTVKKSLEDAFLEITAQNPAIDLEDEDKVSQEAEE